MLVTRFETHICCMAELPGDVWGVVVELLSPRERLTLWSTSKRLQAIVEASTPNCSSVKEIPFAIYSCREVMKPAFHSIGARVGNQTIVYNDCFYLVQTPVGPINDFAKLAARLSGRHSLLLYLRLVELGFHK